MNITRTEKKGSFENGVRAEEYRIFPDWYPILPS